MGQYYVAGFAKLTLGQAGGICQRDVWRQPELGFPVWMRNMHVDSGLFT